MLVCSNKERNGNKRGGWKIPWGKRRERRIVFSSLLAELGLHQSGSRFHKELLVVRKGRTLNHSRLGDGSLDRNSSRARRSLASLEKVRLD